MKKSFLRAISMLLTFMVVICGVSSLPLNTSAEYKSNQITAIDLEKLLSSCSHYRSTCWTEETWSSFVEEYNNADTALKTSAGMDEIANAYNRLSAAKESLVHDGLIVYCDYCCGISYSIAQEDVLSLSKISYSSAATRCVMDLYLPKTRIGGCPLVIYLHGGAWTSSSNKEYTQTAYAKCAEFGIATLAINYRYASESVNAFDMLDDIQASLAKAKEVAAGYGLELNKVLLTGYSAGAHLSMLYAYSRADVSPIKPVCVFEQSGPVDLTNPKLLQSTLGTETMYDCISWLSGTKVTDERSLIENSEAILAVSPIKYVNSNCVPTVICHGKRDLVIDYSEAEKLVSAFKEYGVTYELITFNSNHALYKDVLMSAYSEAAFADLIDSYFYNDAPDEAHEYIPEVIEKTCTTYGYTLNTCRDCGKYFVSDIVSPSHEVVNDIGYEATCTETGLTDGSHCSACGTVFSQQQVIPEKGHRIAVETVVPATYTSEGEEVTKCTVCGKIFESRVLPELAAHYGVKDSTAISIDLEKLLIKNIPQGLNGISDFLDLAGCTVEVSDSIISTGTAVKIKSFKGEILASFSAVVSGDVTSDGYTDAFDLAVAGEYVNTFTEPDDAAKLEAIDLCGDGYLDANDLAYLIYIVNFEV